MSREEFLTERFAEECVVQFHPPKSEYVNNHPFVLHLWRHRAGFPMPPSILVGLKDRGVLTAVEAAKIRAEQFPHPSPVVGDGPPGRGVPHAPITAPGGTEQ